MRSEDRRPVLCPAAHGAFFSRHHLRQSVSCLSSIENTAPSLTSTFRTMQTRPILSARFWGLVEILVRRQVGLARQTPKMSLQSISRRNTLLAASGFKDVSSMGKLRSPRKLGEA